MLPEPDLFYDFNRPADMHNDEILYGCHTRDLKDGVDISIGAWVTFGIKEDGVVARGQIVSSEERLIAGKGPGTYHAVWVRFDEYLEDSNGK